MPSSEYFRRQADICLRLSLVASDEVVSTLLIAMAQGYMAQDYMAQDYMAQDSMAQDSMAQDYMAQGYMAQDSMAQAESPSQSEPAAIVAQDASPDRETNGA
jgi:pentapeptide MXKDX repeat protein